MVGILLGYEYILLTDDLGLQNGNFVRYLMSGYIRYLVEKHRIPLRRMTPHGYGEAQAIVDNESRQGRAPNCRVEVKILVGEGLQ